MAQHHKRVEIVQKEYEQIRRAEPARAEALRQEERTLIGYLKTTLWEISIRRIHLAGQRNAPQSQLTPRARKILDAILDTEASSERLN